MAEPVDSLDAVYIGASPTFTSWIAPVAWKKYGIKVRTLGNTSQPFEATKSILKVARRRQPNAVFMIALNGLYKTEEMNVTSIHSTTDNFPNCLEKLSLLKQLCGDYCDNFEDTVEIIFPLVRYHSRWNTLSYSSFHHSVDLYKGTDMSDSMLNGKADISSLYCRTEIRQPLLPHTQEYLTSLLDYCSKEDVKVVFVISAQYRDEIRSQWFNTIADEIEEYAFPVIDEIEEFDEIGLDDKNDFSNEYHSNIHGALKITDYLSRYLIDNYDLGNSKGDIADKSWDEAFELYYNAVSASLTDEELDGMMR